MAYDPARFQIERFNVELNYHAAFNYWNLRGVIAERWGHGPIFGARNENPLQVALLPAATPQDPGKDVRIQASYGISASGVLAEGETWVLEAQDIAVEWLRDAVEVLKPKRTTRAQTQLFGLYPVEDAVQASRRLRGRYFRADNLESLLPNRLRNERDRFHAAVNWFIPTGDRTHSLIAGAVGPPHQGQFFAWPNPERDRQWWMGLNLVLLDANDDPGIDDPVAVIERQMRDAFEDLAHIAGALLQDVIP